MDIRRQPGRRRLWIILAVAAAIVGVAALTAFGALARIGKIAPEIDGDVIWVGTVERGPMAIEVRAPGRLIPEEERWVTAPAEGVVEDVRVKPGDTVEPGSVLIRLRNPALRRELLESELTIRAERASASAFETRLENELLDLEASVAGLYADLREAELRSSTDERLNADGLVSSFDLEVGRFRAEEMRRRHEIEQQRLERRHASFATEQAAAQARVERAEALGDYLRREVDSLTVRAETAGIVTEVASRVGSRVQLGEQLARIIDPARLRAQLDVPQSRAREVGVGQTVLIDTRGSHVEGVVSRIDPSVREGVVLVDIDLVEPLPAGARAELRVDGLIRVEQLGDVLHVRRPLDARESASIDLFRLDGSDEAVRAHVELGRLSVNQAQVIAGLDEGDRVILSDTSNFSGADRIRIRK